MKNTPDKKQPGAQPAKKGPHRLPVILSADHISISEFIRRALRRDASLRRLYTEGSKPIIKDASGAERELVWSDAL